MKKTLTVLLALALTLTLCAALADISFTPGEYVGAGAGMMGDVIVRAEFSESGIISVAVVTHNETPGISDPAIETIPALIVQAQSLDVDTVSNATITSRAIIAAVADCALQAGADVALLTGETALPENAYIGVGKGIGGELKIIMIVEDGKITSIEVTDHAETDFICGPAIEKIPAAIVESQSFDVDTVTGATVTSRAIIAAAKDAAAQAGLDVSAMEAK